MLVEVCTDSIDGARTAQEAGACRIELCAALSEGGVTPSAALIQKTRETVDIQVYVIIRPRGGDFRYIDTELEVMKADIHYCGKTGCNGVVIGILHPDGSVNREHCSELVQIARSYGMGVTFHRAFDRSNDLFRALEDVIDIGCERILTSGGYPSAAEGAEVICELIKKAGKRITIMAGAGITFKNVKALIRSTRVKEIHGTFRSILPSVMFYQNTRFSPQEYEIAITDLGIINFITKIKA